jgi:hypothetical protein
VDIRYMLKKSKSYIPNVNRNELKSLKFLRSKRDIRILQAEEGNCTVVLDKSKYKYRLSTLLQSGVYKPSPKDLTAKVERNIQKLFAKHKTALPADLKSKLTPYHNKPPHPYGIP